MQIAEVQLANLGEEIHMKLFKYFIHACLSAKGYEIKRISKPQVRFDNFLNLAQAFEYSLNQSKNVIVPNDIRIKLMARLIGTPPTEAYFIVQALSNCKNINGDVCEFGVAHGDTSALIANEIKLSGNKTLHLFDSFEGLPKPSEKDELKDDIFSLGNMAAYAGTMSSPEGMVIARLKAISFPAQMYLIHKGFIEQLIHKDNNLPKEICFAYVDFDFYEPIKITLKYLHTTTVRGAIIIVDDYDYFSTGSKRAVDEFLEEKNSAEKCYECVVPNTQYGHFAILTKRE
jgi:hypothetical protein